MIILGIDPGTATTGFGVIKIEPKKRPVILDYGVIRTNKQLSDSSRLLILGADLEKLLRKFKPELISVERLFFNTNQKTVMAVSQARGVVLYLCEKQRLPILEFTPLQVKNNICGYGAAPKKQVQRMAGYLLGLKAVPKPDDAADALALALCAAHKKISPGTGQKI